jgi:hypothetical protein
MESKRGRWARALAVALPVAVITAGCNWFGGDDEVQPPSPSAAPGVFRGSCINPGQVGRIDVPIAKGAPCNEVTVQYPGTSTLVPATVLSRTDDGNTTHLDVTAQVPEGAVSGIVHVRCDGKIEEEFTLKIPCDDAGSSDASSCQLPPEITDMAAKLKALALVCPAYVPLALEFFKHSAAVLAKKPVAHDQTTFKSVASFRMALAAAALTDLFGSAFPCGKGPNGQTLCPPGAAAPKEGEYAVIIAETEKAIPEADAKNHYQLGFVWDADGDPTNNYTSSTAYPDDLFKASDRWYQAVYAPGMPWTMKVDTAHGTTITPASSSARIILKGTLAIALIPTSELFATALRYRISMFRHLGDFGLQAPNDYDGSVYPAVSDPLTTIP